MKRALVLSLLPVTLWACHAVVELDADLPPEVDAVSLLTFDEEDQLVEATPLVRFDPAAGLLLRRSHRKAVHRLAGWSLADLDLLEIPPGAPSPAAECDPKLSAPRWYAAWTEDEVVPVNASAAPGLTAPWAASCPDPADRELKLESACLEARCRPRIAAQERCRVSLDAGDCGLGTFLVSLLAEEICIAEPPPTCDVRVHAVDPDAPLPFTFERVSVRDDPPTYTGSHIEHADNLHRGFVRDVVVLEGTVVAASAQPGFYCVPISPGEEVERFLSFVDPESMVRTATRAVDGCVVRLAADPHSAGFLGAYYDDPGWFLARFDLTGAPVEVVPVAEASEFPETEFRLAELLVMREIDRIAILFTSLAGPGAESHLYLFDAKTLAPVQQLDLSDEDRAWDVVAVSETELALSLSDRYGLRFLDVRRPVLPGMLPVEGEGQIGTTLMGLYFDEPTDRIVTVGNDKLYIVDSDRSTVRPVLDYASTHLPFVMAPWPVDTDARRRLAVFGSRVVEGGIREAGVIFFDLDSERFLPERHRLVDGIVTRVRTDAAGRLWLALPWSGEIGRLTPL